VTSTVTTTATGNQWDFNFRVNSGANPAANVFFYVTDVQIESGSSATTYVPVPWRDPQDQINAGDPLYLNPSMTTASYDETLDYGTALTSSTIVVTPNVVVLQGSVSYSVQIYVKLNSGDAWTAAPAGATSYLAQNFRYARTVITLTSAAGPNLAELLGVNIKLSSKRVSDSGVGTITNATTGLVVTFNRAFVDADTPRVQPAGTTPLISVVDFTDLPNPTTFTVYLYNTSGTKVTGSFSWSASGF
jgi:hypothetical protein